MKSLFNRIVLFLKSFFKKPAQPEPVKQKAPEAKQRRPRNTKRSQDLSDLLDNLDITFESLKLPSMKESWLERDSIIGLKKLGIHIPSPWEMEWTEDSSKIFLDVSKPLPAIMCVAIPNKEEKENKVYPKIMFAIKYKKLPWHVAYHSGVPYLYGGAYEFHGKLFWMHMYVTVNRKTGAMTFCEELQKVTNVIRVNGKQPTFYVSKQWKEASFLVDDLSSVEAMKNCSMNVMRAMHKWWINRDDRWNVIIKKNGDRITFGVNDKDTPYFFKNRDKVVTENGETKRIIHYVKEHERTRNGKTNVIKQHIRGLREFNWNGYHCKVMSPKLETKTAATFTVGSEESDGQEDMVYLSKVGKMLADFEERKKA